MAAGFPVKADYASGDVLTAAQMNDLSGTLNYLDPTAKGDLFPASSGTALTRLAVGANDTVLTADSSTATGLKWASAAASGSMTLLSTTTLSGAVTTVSSINQTYKNLYITVSDATWNTDDDSPAFYTNVSNVTSLRKINQSGVVTVNLTTNIGDLNDAVQNYKRTGGNNFITFLINDYASTTTYKTFQVYTTYEGTSNNGRICFFTGGFATDTAINSVSFKISSDYVQTGGTMRIYGVN
jgi:hypothetical protein